MYLSIITVTLNNLPGLKQTLNSIRSQNICHAELLEWVVIDGGSTDGTLNFLRTLCLDFPFSFKSERDNGVFDAMNKGIMQSSYKYLYFLNSGDTLASSFVLSDVSKYLIDGSPLIIAGLVEARYKSITKIKDLNPWVCHQSVFVNAALAKEFMYDNGLTYFGDLDLWKRMKKAGCWNVYSLNLVISKFELGGIGNAPKMIFRRLKERRMISDRYGDRIPYFIRLAHSILLYFIYRVLGEDFYYKHILKF